MGFWSAVLGAFESGIGVLALDAAAALINGPRPIHGPDLKNKSFRSDAYGNVFPRCRGVVRCQGKTLWATQIQTSVWKTTSGGLFGIGQQSVYYNKYSQSMFIGFGKKLGGGAAVDILRIWADGKILFSKRTSTGNITGAVTVTVVSGGQQPGSLVLQIDLASGASLLLNAGDEITVPGDPLPYEVQTTVSATGATTISVPIWPPLRQNLAGTGAVSIPGITTAPYDLSSFDPNPHDGSHPSGGYPCPAGGINFYLGSDTQQPDPIMVAHLGAGNVPGYRGLVGVCIHDLQLANYGDHPPQITAEIAFDVASPMYPLVGPIDSNNAVEFIPPFSGTSTLFFQNPLVALPYVWETMGPGAGIVIYRVNTQTNLVEASYADATSTIFGPRVADAEGFIYYVRATALNQWTMFKVDGLAMSLNATYGAANPYQGGMNPPSGMYVFDTFPSLFGINVQVKMVTAMGSFGGIVFLDRQHMLPMGIANPSGLYTVITEYDVNGTPRIVLGDIIQAGFGSIFTVNTPYSGVGAAVGGSSLCVDINGDIWLQQGDTLSHYDCQFSSGVDFQTLQPVLLPPTFARTDYSVASAATSTGAIFYNYSDASIIVFGNIHLAKFDIATHAIILSVAPTSAESISKDVDILGTLIAGNGDFTYVRVDTNTLAVTPYNMRNWFFGGSGPGHGTYDQATNSVWYNYSGQTYRAYLDRGNGSGIGLDSIVSSLMLDAGYDPTQFDVTKLTTAAITTGGVEFERESFLDSLRKLMQLYLFDCAEIDGKLVFVPRGQASILTIPEDDLGALSDPSQYEPRLVEPLEDERDVPRKVTVKYYDLLKGDQQCTQESKRISQPYTSSLTGAKKNTNTKQQIDIVSPVTDNATPIKQQSEKILNDAIAGRFTRKGKLPPKYIRLTPTDVVTYAYKGLLLETRIVEADSGASAARELTGVSQDQAAYTSTAVGTPGSGSGGSAGGGGVSQPPTASTTYTVVPAKPLSQTTATNIHMVDVVATFSPSGRRAFYNARDFTVADPGAGNSQLYYVTVYDPTFAGELVGTVSLTAFCDITPNSVFLGTPAYVFMGTITITHDLVGVVVTSGGSGFVGQAQGFYVNGSGGGGFGTTGDLLTYLLNSQRASFHLQGIAANNQMSKNYTYIDTATNSIAQIKASGGWAADILLYDPTYIYQFITELDDVGYRDWSVNTSYKKLVVSHGFPTAHALPIMPRYWTPNQAPVTIDIPAPNPYNRYQSCTLIDTLDKGHVTNITHGPVMMNFDNRTTPAGNLGTISVMVNERYAGAKARERFYWGLNLGFVAWDAASLISGARITGQYAISNWSVHNTLAAGGGVTPSFGCGYGVGWP